MSTKASDYIAEIARIAELSAAASWLAGQPGMAAENSFSTPTNDTYVGRSLPLAPASAVPAGGDNEPLLHGMRGMQTITEHPARRWYPVIDFSRCTNCMECIDFCLFGVYGIDSVETILVEQPDNCRKGCPACSRVCPQNAIIFPQHKTPAIAGAPMDSGGLKIDLSKLFGAPDEGADALEVAARERDEQLLLAGRQAVGITEELTARLGTATADKPSDELDKLIDELDSLEL
jgi:NAD-dependent dihydropyrimidine dehydrogenase PreA subunit